MHRELEPAALDAAPGAFINKRAVYFAPFVSSGEKSTPSLPCPSVSARAPAALGQGQGRRGESGAGQRGQAGPPGGLGPQPLSPALSVWGGEAAASANAAAASFSLCLRAAAFFSCSAWLFMWALRLFTL